MEMAHKSSFFQIPFMCFFALSACQCDEPDELDEYRVVADYEVKPKALPPNIMLLLDKSGSMNDLVNPQKNVDGTENGNCTTSNCYSNSSSCESTCSTRINELRYAMRAFLNESLEIYKEDSGRLGKFGLALFPTNSGCSEIPDVRFELTTSDEDVELRAKIVEIREYIFEKLYNSRSNDNGSPIRGGTPTGAALRYLSDDVEELQDTSRKNFVLLLTDGLPNCNWNNKQIDNCPSDPNNAQCICTYSEPVSCSTKSSCGIDNCLDKDGTIEAIEKLSEHGIETIVIGFGEEVSEEGSIAEAVMNAMGKAGGDARRCGGNTDCTAYYPATNSGELYATLKEISKKLMPDPCVFELEGEKPSSSELLTVYMDEKRIEAGADTYSYDKSNSSVVFAKGGALCNRLESSPVGAPVHIRIEVLGKLP